MHIKRLIEKLFPICRSITGEGFRQSLKIISEYLPLKIHSFPSGKKCFDWTIPPEWNVKDAYVKDLKGRCVIDMKRNNLHLVGYSIPFRGRVSLKELRSHLHTDKKNPTAIPYIVSYYKPRWGFCVSWQQYQQLHDAEYDVVVDTELKNGRLQVAEFVLPGKSKREIWFSTYLCHPSLANDNLSGVGVAVAVMNELRKRKNRFTYRLLIGPETIGAIAYMARFRCSLERILGGYVVTCAGAKAPLNYKRSVFSNHMIDTTMERTLRNLNKSYSVIPYSPFGSDERQYCSPGIGLAFGSLMRLSHTPKDLTNPFLNEEYPQYHNSLDNLNFVDEDSMQEVKDIFLACAKNLDSIRCYKANYKCEPFLSKHNLYVSPSEDIELCKATFYFASFADGTKSLWDMSEISGVSRDKFLKVAQRFEKEGLVRLIE